MIIRTGIGFDSHRFAEGRRLVLGGVEIEYRLGLDELQALALDVELLQQEDE